MRDLTVVLKYLLTNVIPILQLELRRELEEFAIQIAYRPPELQPADWQRLCEILASYGDPAGIPWKERMRRIINDEEQMV